MSVRWGGCTWSRLWSSRRCTESKTTAILGGLTLHTLHWVQTSCLHAGQGSRGGLAEWTEQSLWYRRAYTQGGGDKQPSKHIRSHHARQWDVKTMKAGRMWWWWWGRSEQISLIRCLWEVMWRKRGGSCHMESWGSSSHAEEEQVQSPFRGSMHGTKEALQGATDCRASE